LVSNFFILTGLLYLFHFDYSNNWGRVNMAQISKKFLPVDVQNRITETLLEAVSQVKGRKDTALFLNDLLTPTERVVLAKRLAEAGREFWQDVVKLAHRLGTSSRFVDEGLLDKKLGFDKKKTLV